MSQQVAEPQVAVNINEDYCSRCSICRSLCPFEAITKDAESGKVVLDIEKCQVCGICYSACPAKAIDTIYYDYGSLLKYLKTAKPKYDSDTLVIMCKGSAPDSAGVERLFGVSKFIPLSVPCVGRLPEELLLQAIAMGIKKIYLLACDENYCRFDRGSSLTGRRILALNRLLEQLGYGREAVTLKRNSLKVKVDKDLCIACGNCVFYCPYHAPKLESPGGISFDLDACRGCGLCVAICPAIALDLDNWERERISTLISQLLSEMRAPKILVFRCQWAVFPPLDEESSPNIRAIDLPCAGRVDAFHLLEAFQKGADGVLIAACPEEDCRQEGVSAKAQHWVEALKQRLGQIGFGDRLHFCFVARRHPEQMDKELRQFGQKIEAIVSERGRK
ncbi:MAG: hydrogenase iron-sulfur subunit [Dehalococcoidales bacterium]|nr:hydrogenase iron-sulfur subunit [Dehalococcoidales bacterium]